MQASIGSGSRTARREEYEQLRVDHRDAVHRTELLSQGGAHLEAQVAMLQRHVRKLEEDVDARDKQVAELKAARDRLEGKVLEGATGEGVGERARRLAGRRRGGGGGEEGGGRPIRCAGRKGDTQKVVDGGWPPATLKAGLLRAVSQCPDFPGLVGFIKGPPCHVQTAVPNTRCGCRGRLRASGRRGRGRWSGCAGRWSTATTGS